jgi:hypothetical protein
LVPSRYYDFIGPMRKHGRTVPVIYVIFVCFTTRSDKEYPIKEYSKTPAYTSTFNRKTGD